MELEKTIALGYCTYVNVTVFYLEELVLVRFKGRIAVLTKLLSHSNCSTDILMHLDGGPVAI